MRIYTDGSCIGNPGPGGWAVVIAPEEGTMQQPLKYSGSNPDTTNNRMELQAIIEALKLCQNLSVRHEVSIVSDSQWAIKCGTREWKRKKNLDLWVFFDRLNRPSIKYVWVRGHDGNKWNEEADSIANREARSIERRIDA